jgi:hypothetical protein
VAKRTPAAAIACKLAATVGIVASCSLVFASGLEATTERAATTLQPKKMSVFVYTSFSGWLGRRLITFQAKYYLDKCAPRGTACATDDCAPPGTTCATAKECPKVTLRRGRGTSGRIIPIAREIPPKVRCFVNVEANGQFLGYARGAVNFQTASGRPGTCPPVRPKHRPYVNWYTVTVSATVLSLGDAPVRYLGTQTAKVFCL